MSVSKGIVPLAEIRFADGRRYWMVATSVSDFLLNTVFLKYFLCCLLIYGLLDGSLAVEAARQVGYATAVLWALVGAVTLVWFAVALGVLGFLWRRGYVRVIYTPFITLVLYVVTAGATHLILDRLGSPHAADLTVWVNGLVRDMIVILVLDVMFGSYVAPMHPAFLARLSEDAPELASQRSAPQPAEALPAAPPSTTEAEAPEAPDIAVRIGTEDVMQGELVYIRAEDHYLRVVTNRRRILTRGRLSDALSQLDFRLGIQVNRSTWVAFSAIEEIGEDAKGIQTLTLTGGETERVAQSRRIAFQTAMNAWANPAGAA
jgi:LytTr DNA-binding domain